MQEAPKSAVAQLPAEKTVSARRYGGVSATERKAQRRERLLEAGFDVFGRIGYRDTTMRMICSQAKLTDRYFYEHFATVDEVYTAVHQRLSADAAKTVATDLASALMAEPQVMVRAGLKSFFEFIKADPRRAQILLIDAVTSGLTNPLNINARISRYVDVLRQRFKLRYPHLDTPVDVELILGGFGGMVIHTASVWTQRRFDTPVDQLVEHTAYAWDGLHHWLSRHNRPPVQP
jgi:AcrR family transcriptional regulator